MKNETKVLKTMMNILLVNVWVHPFCFKICCHYLKIKAQVKVFFHCRLSFVLGELRILIHWIVAVSSSLFTVVKR